MYALRLALARLGLAQGTPLDSSFDESNGVVGRLGFEPRKA